MRIVLSPAKSLELARPLPEGLAPTQPSFLGDAEALIRVLQALTVPQLMRLQGISEELAALNVGRNRAWTKSHTRKNARPALFTFNGDAYGGLDAWSLGTEDRAFAQEHLRILSGLYGLLRPLDLMHPYRLEMGTRLVTPRGRDLYAFWGDRVAKLMDRQTDRVVNLASEEYAKVLKPMAAGMITPVFQDWTPRGWKVISFYAKRARGLMARYLIQSRSLEALNSFEAEGYALAAEVSTPEAPVFRRRG